MKIFKNLFLLTALLFFAVACSNDGTSEIASEYTIEEQPISVLPDGYLHFNSQLTFDDYVATLRGENTLRSASSISNFKSLKQLKNDLSSQSLRSESLSGDEIEEGTMEEYRLAQCEAIIQDELLMNVLDTTLRISVGEKYYKITESGTFCGNFDETDKVDLYALNYSEYEHCFKLEEENTYSYDGILFRPFIKTTDEESSLRAATPEINKSQYGLSEHSVSMKNLWIFGFDHSRENSFDSSHRVQLNIYNINLFFYKQSGIKLALQKKKTILWIIHYWVEDNAEDRVIGFNNFEGVLTLSQPVPPLSPQPIGQNPKALAAPIAGYTVNFILGKVVSLPVYRDFTTSIQSWVVERLVNGTPATKAQVDKIYDAAYDGAINALRSKGKSFLVNQLTKNKPDPLSVIENLAWDGKTIKHVLFGENSFGSGKTKSIIFNLSFGITVKYDSSFGAQPFTPTNYTIKSADIYGAVKYKGQWKGVRIKGK